MLQTAVSPADSRRRSIFFGIAAALGLAASPVPAQEAAPGAAGEGRSGPSAAIELEEIVVTARRQSEGLQSVPIAVSAFDAEALYRNRIQDLGDLENFVPNLNLHVGDASNAVIYIRGVGQIDSISFNDPGVGVYLDDVYMGRVQGSFLDVVDPARVEVLRGPQGTLYGRNTIGGAVKFYSARPGNEFEAYLDATAGNFNRRDLKLGIGGPIAGDLLSGKIALATLQRDGYTDNLFDGEEDFDKDTVVWRGGLLLTPGDDLSVYFVVDGSDANPSRSRTPHRETAIFSVVSGEFIPPGDDPFVVDVNFNDLESLETFGVAATVEYALGERVELKSITSYREMDYRTHLDLDGTTDSSFGIYDFEDQEQISQELQILLDGERYSAVAGLYYFDEEDLTFGGAVAPDFFVPVPGFGFFPFPIINAGQRDQENTSRAVYAHFDYDLTDALGLTVGLRYTEEEKKVVSRGEEFFGTGVTTAEEMERVFGTGVGFAPTGFAAEDDWDSLSPKLGLDYRLAEEVLVYFSASRGFKSGGFNGRLTDRAQPFDPETLWSYEAGLKSTFAQRRVRLNAAAFYNDYEDFQLSRFSIDPDTGGFLSLFENAAEATIYGAEVELAALLGRGLSLALDLGYLSGEYDEFVGDFGAELSDARELVNAPRWTARLGLDYELAVGEGGTLALGGALSYRDKTYLTVSSSEVLAQDAYSLFDATVRYRSGNGHWTLILAGRNLTDREYREHGFDLSASPGVQLGYYGAPRTWSFNTRYRF